MPPDAGFQADMAAAAQKRAQTEAAVNQQRQAELIGAGYTETNVDPNTGVGTLAFDPNDPFSKAALLKKNYDASRARTAQQMGSGGGLYAGSFQQAQDIGNRGQVQAESGLQDSLFSFLARNSGAFKQAGIDEQTAGIRADADRMGRIATNPLYQPSDAAPRKPATKPVTPPKLSAPKGRTIAANPSGKGPARGTKLVRGRKTPKGRIGTYVNTVKGP
jgi:hypothetical protein